MYWVRDSNFLSNNFDPTLEKYGLCKPKQVALLEPLITNSDYDKFVATTKATSKISYHLIH